MQVYQSIEQVTLTRCAVTVGFFDGFHLGHQYLLRRMLSYAKLHQVPTLVYTMWPHPAYLLGTRDAHFKLLTDLDQKLQLMEDFGIQHVLVQPFTHEFASKSPEQFLDTLVESKCAPSAVFVGYDHHFGARGQGNYETLLHYLDGKPCQAYRGSGVSLDGQEISSTVIRNLVGEGHVALAYDYLGHPFALRGIVEHGYQVGRSLGYPTANVKPIYEQQLLPAEGVYAGFCRPLGDSEPHFWPSLISVGRRLTVHPDSPLVIEVNLLDFHGDLYGCQVEVLFTHWLRSQELFPNMEALREKIDQDLQNARKLLA